MSLTRYTSTGGREDLHNRWLFDTVGGGRLPIINYSGGTEHVAHSMGKALKPERVLFARDVPKTRSAKIMRRVIRATYLGRDPGDLSSLENPGAGVIAWYSCSSRSRWA